MGAHQSKDELVYQQVSYNNIEGIKALRREGAGLEWVDKEGKTPLIVACMRPDLLEVAKVLIDLGANVNAYRPGGHTGTPLHHAAKRGLDQTVDLLLSSDANPFVMNDNCQTPLDLARAKGHCNVVRAIERRLCLFSGWLREIYGPSILEAFAPQWVSRKIWAVVLPCDSRNPRNPRKFDLAMYPDLQIAQPRAVIALWKVHIEEPKFNQPDPALVIVDKTTKTRYKFLSAYEGDKQQMQWFYNACRGIFQQNSYIPVAPIGATTSTLMPMANQPHLNAHASATSSSAGPASEDVHLAMAINASLQTAIAEGAPVTNTTNTSGWETSSESTSHNGWGQADTAPPPKPKVEPSPDPYNGWSGVRPSSSEPQLHMSQLESVTVPSAQEAPPSLSVPSAPPIIEETFYDDPIHYPSIDSSPIQLPPIESKATCKTDTYEGSSSSTSGSCVICLDAPAEGACIPCGHMAGCMSCLNEIKAKNWGCPVCRAAIDQVVRLYAV